MSHPDGCRDPLLDHDHDSYSGEPLCADCGEYLDAETVCGGLDSAECAAAQVAAQRIFPPSAPDDTPLAPDAQGFQSTPYELGETD